MNQYNSQVYAPQSPRGSPYRQQNMTDNLRVDSSTISKPYKSNHQGVAPESRLSNGQLSSPMKPFQQTQAEVGREAEEMARLKKIKQEREALEIKVEHLENENKNLIKQIRLKDDELSQKGSLKSELTNIKRLYADLAQKFEQVNKDYKNLKDEMQPLRKDLKDRDQQVRDLQEKLNQVKEKQKLTQKYEQENKDLKTRIQLLDKTVTKLKEQRDTSQSSSQQQGSSQPKNNDQVRNLQQLILDQKKDMSAKIKTLLDENDRLRDLTKVLIYLIDEQSEISSISSPVSTEGNLNQLLKEKTNEIKKLVAEISYLKETINNSQQQQSSKTPRTSEEQKEIIKLKGQVQQLQRQLNEQNDISRSPSVMGSEGVRQSATDSTLAIIQLEMKIKQLKKEKIDQIQELKVTHAQELKDLKDEYHQEMQVYLKKIRELEGYK